MLLARKAQFSIYSLHMRLIVTHHMTHALRMLLLCSAYMLIKQSNGSPKLRAMPDRAPEKTVDGLRRRALVMHG
jgi:hypothetical protein